MSDKKEKQDTRDEAEVKRDQMALCELKKGNSVEYYEHSAGGGPCLAMDIVSSGPNGGCIIAEFPYHVHRLIHPGDLVSHPDGIFEVKRFESHDDYPPGVVIGPSYMTYGGGDCTSTGYRVDNGKIVKIEDGD